MRSADSLESNHIDLSEAAQLAIQRELLRLRKAFKEARATLVEGIRQRENPEGKLAGRIMTLGVRVDQSTPSMASVI